MLLTADGAGTPRKSTQELLPGMAIQGEQPRTNSPSFVVPRDALTRRGEQWLIYSVVEGKAKQFEVELIADMGEKMAISNEQLKVGQPVVVRVVMVCLTELFKLLSQTLILRQATRDRYQS